MSSWSSQSLKKGEACDSRHTNVRIPPASQASSLYQLPANSHVPGPCDPGALCQRQTYELLAHSPDVISSKSDKPIIRANKSDRPNKPLDQDRHPTRVRRCRIVLKRRSMCSKHAYNRVDEDPPCVSVHDLDCETIVTARADNGHVEEMSSSKERNEIVCFDGDKENNSIIEYSSNDAEDKATLTSHPITQESDEQTKHKNNIEVTYESDPDDNSIIEYSSNECEEKATLISHPVYQDCSGTRLYQLCRIERNNCPTTTQNSFDCSEQSPLTHQRGAELTKNDSIQYHLKPDDIIPADSFNPIFHPNATSILNIGGPESAFKPITSEEKSSLQVNKMKYPCHRKLRKPPIVKRTSVNTSKCEELVVNHQVENETNMKAIKYTSEVLYKKQKYDNDAPSRSIRNKRSNCKSRNISIKPPNVDYIYNTQAVKRSLEKESAVHFKHNMLNGSNDVSKVNQDISQSQLCQNGIIQNTENTDVYVQQHNCVSNSLFDHSKTNDNDTLNYFQCQKSTNDAKNEDLKVCDPNNDQDSSVQKNLQFITRLKELEKQDKDFKFNRGLSNSLERPNSTFDNNKKSLATFAFDHCQSIKELQSKLSMKIYRLISPKKSSLSQKVSTSPDIIEENQTFYTPPNEIINASDRTCENSNNDTPSKCCAFQQTINFDPKPNCLANHHREEIYQKERRTRLMRKNLNLREAACDCPTRNNGNNTCGNASAAINENRCTCHDCNHTTLIENISSGGCMANKTQLKYVHFPKNVEYLNEQSGCETSNRVPKILRMDRATSVSPQSVCSLRRFEQGDRCIKCDKYPSCRCCHNNVVCHFVKYSDSDESNCPCSQRNASLTSVCSRGSDPSPSCSGFHSFIPQSNAEDECSSRECFKRCALRSHDAPSQCRPSRGRECVDYGFSVIVFLLGMIFALLFPYL